MFARLVGKLYRDRWGVAAIVVAVGGLAWSVSGGWAMLLFALALLLAVIILAPHGADGGVPVEAAENLDGGIGALSATELAEALPAPLVLFDRRGITLHANAAATGMFGALAPGISLQLKFRAPEMQNLLARVLSGGEVNAAVDYAERVPVERLFRVSVTYVGDDAGLFVMLFKDQSEARRIDRMRADFIANASHELRTPLASIAGFVETLRGPAKNDPKARDQFLQIMQNQTGRMARLIDDLLSLSRLEMKPYLKPGATVDIGQAAKGVIDSLRPLAEETGVEIEADLPISAVRVAGDRDELFQVFENLLENAIKYGHSGGKVAVSVNRPDGPAGEVTVTFRDFGPGIPAEHIPRITERFYRVDVETSRAQKGTGLGLSIVKHILTRHNARLSIKSDIGEGAAFTVHFPAT